MLGNSSDNANKCSQPWEISQTVSANLPNPGKLAKRRRQHFPILGSHKNGSGSISQTWEEEKTKNNFSQLWETLRPSPYPIFKRSIPPP